MMENVFNVFCIRDIVFMFRQFADYGWEFPQKWVDGDLAVRLHHTSIIEYYHNNLRYNIFEKCMERSVIRKAFIQHFFTPYIWKCIFTRIKNDFIYRFDYIGGFNWFYFTNNDDENFLNELEKVILKKCTIKDKSIKRLVRNQSIDQCRISRKDIISKRPEPVRLKLFLNSVYPHNVKKVKRYSSYRNKM